MLVVDREGLAQLWVEHARCARVAHGGVELLQRRLVEPQAAEARRRRGGARSEGEAQLGGRAIAALFARHAARDHLDVGEQVDALLHVLPLSAQVVAHEPQPVAQLRVRHRALRGGEAHLPQPRGLGVGGGGDGGVGGDCGLRGLEALEADERGDRHARCGERVEQLALLLDDEPQPQQHGERVEHVLARRLEQPAQLVLQHALGAAAGDLVQRAPLVRGAAVLGGEEALVVLARPQRLGMQLPAGQDPQPARLLQLHCRERAGGQGGLVHQPPLEPARLLRAGEEAQLGVRAQRRPDVRH
mmetsp:Transcript_77630/g.187530  ORF Transcript_77630/g.187530 Transcript_77630/m.187530 type:complete len:301 (-) Transcript_77630:157-1059(-)